MFRFSAKFQQAWHRTFILAVTALVMIFVWSFFRMPDAVLAVVVFAFLSAVRLSSFASQEKRLRVLASLIAGTASLQYIISATDHLLFLNVLLPALAGGIVLKVMAPASAYQVLLTGFLTYSASTGAYAATERFFDILLAGLVAWGVSSFAATEGLQTAPEAPEKMLPTGKIVIETFTIFCAALLYRFLSMPQGIWIVLTVIFIYMVQSPAERTVFLVKQRIFSVPAGIMLGGLYSAAVVMLDYRLAYLTLLFGATGFFMLYYRHDFFWFSLFFMFAFTVCADWMSGALRDFHFMQFLFARSLATAIGAALLLVIEKAAEKIPERIIAS